jgi:plastocyanin
MLGVMVGMPTAAAGGGCHPGGALEMTTGAEAVGFIAECKFEPTVMYIDKGEEVTWSNKDIFDHTVTGASLSWGSERPLAQGDTITYSFKEEGVFPFYCAYHPSMVGAVVVGSGGAAAAGGIVPKIDEVRTDQAARPATEPIATTEPATNYGLLMAIAAGLAVLIGVGAFLRNSSLRRRATSAASAP